MDVFVLNIIFLCRKMVIIRVDLMIKLQHFPLLPYRWSTNLLRRNGNNYLAWNSELRRNGNKPLRLSHILALANAPSHDVTTVTLTNITALVHFVVKTYLGYFYLTLSSAGIA